MSNLVAISATCAPFHGANRVRLSANYVRSLEGAGLVPVVVPPLADASRAAEILDAVGGLLLTGGEDVDPARYGAVPHAALGAVHGARDATEVALLAAARSRGAPVLAICRGIQILNVALGGTLVQDLPSERPSAVQHDQPHDRAERAHEVTIVAGSKLARATGATVMSVNSYHHQAVAGLGGDLQVTATAPDGVIEAVEVTDAAWWVLAVQWHPEDLTDDVREWDRGIFKAFATEVLRRV
ncbi:MAG: gamma-glutamyl-gamma-aminobutyrate hydrolase family protein [Gemmatimonadales bacterium]